ncbi:MAG TPA: YciI family protein [Polyangiaceae bacterium]|nr:YciI family protein [Polyangiaceae bacterium]
MRFIVMHKVDAQMEAGAPPDQSIIGQMGQLVQESIKAGTFKNGAGLHRSASRARLVFRGGKRTVTRGPYAGKNELVNLVLMVQTPSMDSAIDQAGRVAAVLGDVEIEVGPVVEAWDLGMMPKPADLKRERFLLLVKGDAETESGQRDAKRRAALAELEQKLFDEGILLARERLAPTSRASRVAPGQRGRQAWTDGPFAESKELVAGFSILELPTKEDALAWADRYAAILVRNEVDVIELEDPAAG